MPEKMEVVPAYTAYQEALAKRAEKLGDRRAIAVIGRNIGEAILMDVLEGGHKEDGDSTQN